MSIFTKYQLERKKCYDKQWVTFAQCLWMVQVSSFSTWQGNIITVPGAQCLHIFRGFQQDISMLFLGMGQNEWPPRMASWMLKIANSLGRSSLEPDFWQATLVQDLRRFSEFHEMGGANMGESRGSEDPCSAIAFTTFYNNMWRPIMYPIVWGAWNGTQKAQNVKGWWESEDTSEAVALATKMWFSQVSGWWDGHGSEYGFSKCVDFFWYFKSSTVFETMIPDDANDWCLSVGLKPPRVPLNRMTAICSPLFVERFSCQSGNKQFWYAPKHSLKSRRSSKRRGGDELLWYDRQPAGSVQVGWTTPEKLGLEDRVPPWLFWMTSESQRGMEVDTALECLEAKRSWAFQHVDCRQVPGAMQSITPPRPSTTDFGLWFLAHNFNVGNEFTKMNLWSLLRNQFRKSSRCWVSQAAAQLGNPSSTGSLHWRLSSCWETPSNSYPLVN